MVFIIYSLIIMQALSIVVFQIIDYINNYQVIERQGAVHQYKAVVDFKLETLPPYPVTSNDESLYEHGKEVAEILLGKQNMEVFPVTMGGEHFSFYAQKMPAAMLVNGIS